MFADFDTNHCRERNKVETAFSVLKRRFGGDPKARKYRYQVKEIKIKLILHNLTKVPQAVGVVLIVEEFNRAHNLGGYPGINGDGERNSHVAAPGLKKG
jgi:hypothetical protein